jgi:chemotaxis signal transduction protein
VVDLAYVAEVARLRGLGATPERPRRSRDRPDRGRLVPVVDLRNSRRRSREAGWLVVVGAGDASVGLLADGGVEVSRVPSRGLAPPLVRGGAAEPLLRGLTKDAVAVIDVGALLTDPRLATGKAG